MNFKKRYLYYGIYWGVYWGILLTSFSALGEDNSHEVLIRSTKTRFSEFNSFLQVEFIKTYAQYQLDEVRSRTRPIHLSSLFKKSQAEFLSHNPRSAERTYQKIVRHIHAFDWNEEERKIIFYTLFRLAQLKLDTKKKKLFLKEAMTFGLNLKIDFNIFPPPLTTMYSKIRKSVNRVLLDLKKIFPDHELIVINGKTFKRGEKVKLGYGMYRISAYSSSHTPWSQTLSLSRLIVQTVRTHSLTDPNSNCRSGTIANLQTQLKKSLKGKILFPNFCVYNLKTKSAKFNHYKPLKMMSKSHLKRNFKKAKSKENIWENWKSHKKMWMIGGVALSGVVLYFLLKDNKVPPNAQRSNSYPIIKVKF